MGGFHSGRVVFRPAFFHGNNMSNKVYGYQIFLSDHLVAWSGTLYTTKAAILESMNANLLDICNDISDEDKTGTFRWCDRFDPDDPGSTENYDECLRNYEVVKAEVNGRRYEGDSPPQYELECFIKEYPVEEGINTLTYQEELQ